VLLLHNDAYFARQGDLEGLAALLQENPQLAAVGPVSNNVEGAQRRSAADLQGTLVFPEGAIAGHCVLVRSELLESVGPLDERFAGYGCDEADWFRRARQLGYRWAVDERTWVYHEGGSFGKEQIERGSAADRRRFREKWRQEPGSAGF